MSELDGWEPGRWWRAVLVADGSLWCESSSEEEVREAASRAPSPARIDRLYRRTEEAWRVMTLPPTEEPPRSGLNP